MDVEISCAGEDRLRFERFFGGLSSADLDVGWAETSARDDRWWQRTNPMLTDPGCVVVLWTEKTARDPLQISIARAAFVRKMLIQIVVETCEPPAFFGRQAADWSDWTGNREDARFSNLLEKARELAAVRREERAAAIKVIALRRESSARIWRSRRRFIMGSAVVAGGVGATLAGGYVWLFRYELFPQTEVTEAGRTAGIAKIHPAATLSPPGGGTQDLTLLAGNSQLLLTTNSGILRMAVLEGIAPKYLIERGSYRLTILAPDTQSFLTCGRFENPGAIHEPVDIMPGAYTVPTNSKNLHFARICDMEGRILQRLQGHEGEVSGGAFSPDCTMVVTASEDKTARVWDTGTGALLATLQHDRGLKAAEWSPTDDFLVTSTELEQVFIWNTRTWQRVATLREDYVSHARFSPDGKRLVVSGQWDRPVRIYNVPSFMKVVEFAGRPATNIEFSPDGRWLLCADDERRVSLWDAKSGTRLASVDGHNSRVNWVSFSPDGSHFASTSIGDSDTVQLWRIETSSSG